MSFMAIERAIWFPFWYESDQSIAVGEVGDFDFFRDPPVGIESEGLPVFYHGNWHEECLHLYNRKRTRIVRIWHPVLGAIRSIDANDLDYTFTMIDGRVLKVEAEESPGLVYSHPTPISDWRIFVEIESA